MIRVKNKIIHNYKTNDFGITYYVEDDSRNLFNIIVYVKKLFPDSIDIYGTVVYWDCSFSFSLFNFDVHNTMRKLDLDRDYDKIMAKQSLMFVDEHFMEIMGSIVEKWMI